MRWKVKPKPKPKLHDRRIVRCFCFFPLRLKNATNDNHEIRWLEHALIKQVRVLGYWINTHEWEDEEWAD